MDIDPPEFRRRLAAKVASSPLVNLPAGLGALSTIFAMSSGEPLGVFGIVGISGLLFSAGAALTQLIAGRRKLKAAVQQEVAAEVAQTEEAQFQQLERRLVRAGDSRAAALLGKLRDLRARLNEKVFEASGLSPQILPEIQQKSRQLYASCLTSLERTLVLWKAAEGMSTPETKQQLLDRREDLLAEVDTTVQHLGKTVDGLYAELLEQDELTDDISRLRTELDLSLEVARRVDQRIEELERLSSVPTRLERE